MNIMVDLETAGTKPKSAIFSIGAVKFDKTGILGRFHTGVVMGSCDYYNLSTSGETFRWWLEQSEEARTSLLERTHPDNATDIATALVGFSMWLGDEPRLFGNGATFDNMLLRDAYDACGLDYPVKFWNDLCYRTMKTLVPDVKLERKGVHHNALDDAESQALHMIKICEKLGVEL